MEGPLPILPRPPPPANFKRQFGLQPGSRSLHGVLKRKMKTAIAHLKPEQVVKSCGLKKAHPKPPGVCVRERERDFLKILRA